MSSDLATNAELLLRHYDRLTAAEVVEGLHGFGPEELFARR
jgi:hypothetical protein